MADTIVPIDILERYESENSVSAVPSNDLVYVFYPNKNPATEEISSYSAGLMTVGNLVDLYNGFCEWEQYNQLLDKFNELSSYYYNVVQPIMLSSFPKPSDLTGTYMCRVQRTSNDFPYNIDKTSAAKKRTEKNPDPDYKNALSVRGAKMMYHGWADYQTKATDVDTLAWLAPANEPLSSSNGIAQDKYLEWRKQFIISLLMNRKRILMASTSENYNLYQQAIRVSRNIRFSNYKEQEEIVIPDLELTNEKIIQV